MLPVCVSNNGVLHEENSHGCSIVIRAEDGRFDAQNAVVVKNILEAVGQDAESPEKG